MQMKYKRLFTFVPALVGIIYGASTMLVHNITVHATGRCCGQNTPACGTNQYCAQINDLTACDPNNLNYCVSVND